MNLHGASMSLDGIFEKAEANACSLDPLSARLFTAIKRFKNAFALRV